MQIKSVLSFPTMGFYNTVRFSQDYDLFKVQFRQISLFLINLRLPINYSNMQKMTCLLLN
jgi:hypothetical protein